MKLVTLFILLASTVVAVLGTTSSMRRAEWRACRVECAQGTEARGEGCVETCTLPHWLSLQSSKG